MPPAGRHLPAAGGTAAPLPREPSVLPPRPAPPPGAASPRAPSVQNRWVFLLCVYVCVDEQIWSVLRRVCCFRNSRSPSESNKVCLKWSFSTPAVKLNRKRKGEKIDLTTSHHLRIEGFVKSVYTKLYSFSGAGNRTNEHRMSLSTCLPTYLLIRGPEEGHRDD